MRKLTASILTLLMLLCVITPAVTANATELIYSNKANSGVRHEVCTTLDGTTVDTYYTGSNTYEALSAMSGDALLQALRTLMKTTHTYQTSYDECRDLSVKTDCENGDGTTINLTYTSFVVTMNEYINNTTDGGGWNREHVWPKSLGGFNTTGAGSDLHHIRPTDKSVNGKRGNEKYGIPTNGQPVTGTVTVQNMVGGHSDNKYFEPLDNVKGDVARICLYVWVRYGGELSKCSSITNVFQSVDVLLQWHEADPVDTWEMGRNEVVYAIQGNRNVFIDYPELAWLVFEQKIPEDAVTPSSNANKCEHTNTELRNVKEATCAETGFSGDVYCVDCEKLVTAGVSVPTTEHKNTEIRNAWDATCGKTGCTGDVYCKDCNQLVKVGDLTPATGKHNFGEWISSEDGGVRTCNSCGRQEVDPNYVAPEGANWTVIIIAAAAVVVLSCTAAIFLLRKKKEN